MSKWNLYNKPEEPSHPLKEFSTYDRLETQTLEGDYYAIEDFLKLIPIETTHFTFEYESDCDYGDFLYLNCFKIGTKPNIHYAGEMLVYEKDLAVYKKNLEKWEAWHKTYEEAQAEKLKKQEEKLLAAKRRLYNKLKKELGES